MAARRQALAQTERATARDFSPRANVFDELGYNEVQLSGFFGWLLDPLGSHGQGARYLELFLDYFAGDLAGFPRDQLEQTVVRVEVATLASNGFIDILVEHPDGGTLALENKPFAAFQDRQVARYLADVRLRSPGKGAVVAMIGWAGDPMGHLREHLADEADRAPECSAVSYVAVGAWVGACREASRSLRMSDLLAQCDDHLGRWYGAGPGLETDMIVEEALVTPARLRAALGIVAAGESIKQEVLHRLVSRIEVELAAFDPIDDEFTMGVVSGNLSFDVGDNKARLSLWFDKRGFKDISFGLRDARRSTDERQVRPGPKAEYLERRFGKSQFNKYGWSYWHLLDSQGPFGRINSQDMIELWSLLASEKFVFDLRTLLEDLKGVGC